MGTVVALEDYRRTAQGEAICLNCRHTWQAAAPTGVEWLECPKCHLVKGKFRYTHVFEDRMHWECKCGNDLFHITPDETYCPNCGATHKDF